jgi:hypothetical protein
VTPECRNVGLTSSPKRSAHRNLRSGGRLPDLNDVIPSGSGWTLQWAVAINDRGQITGYGVVNGQTHAFLLTPQIGNKGILPNASDSKPPSVFTASTDMGCPNMKPACPFLPLPLPFAVQAFPNRLPGLLRSRLAGSVQGHCLRPVNELHNRSEARVNALKAAIDSDSSKDGKIKLDSPALGNAVSRLPGRGKR